MRQYLDFIDPDGAAFWNLRPDALTLFILAAGAFILCSIHAGLQHALFALDWFNIIIHEAGHPIFGLFGSRWLMFAGGTLMQLLWPIGCYGVFLHQSQPKSADFCLFWLGSNFLNIGPYMADARAQLLPLIGGGEHDWAYLLDSVGLLPYDTKLGAAALYFGCFLMAFSAYTVLDHVQKERRKTQTLPGATP